MKPLIERICTELGHVDDDANDEFINEAFTVAHETQMTPRQMAERIAELEKRKPDYVWPTIKDYEVSTGNIVGEGMTGFGIGWNMARATNSMFLDIPIAPDPEPVLPAGLPPLPPGTRYAGQLKDHAGDVMGYAFDFNSPEHGWVHSGSLPFGGRADWPGAGSAQWHVAVPITQP